jgi:hypothetical protein
MQSSDAIGRRHAAGLHDPDSDVSRNRSVRSNDGHLFVDCAWLNRRKYCHRLARLQEIEDYVVRDCRETEKASGGAERSGRGELYRQLAQMLSHAHRRLQSGQARGKVAVYII